jgi:hypothetical protein
MRRLAEYKQAPKSFVGLRKISPLEHKLHSTHDFSLTYKYKISFISSSYTNFLFKATSIYLLKWFGGLKKKKKISCVVETIVHEIM